MDEVDVGGVVPRAARGGDGSQISLVAPATQQPANRGFIARAPASAGVLSVGALRLDEGDWVITAQTLAEDGGPAAGGAESLTLAMRWGAGRSVLQETILAPGHGMAFARHADFIEVVVSIPARAFARQVAVMARKSLFGPNRYNKDSLVLANGLVTVAQFAESVQVIGTPADTVQPLTNGGVPLAPPAVVGASGVLELPIGPRTEQLQFASAAQNQLVWRCVS